MESGGACSSRLARHVYQAGSRVGATRFGWIRNCHPYTSISPSATSSIHAQAGSPRLRTAGSVGAASGGRTSVSAMRSQLVPELLARDLADRGQREGLHEADLLRPLRLAHPLHQELQQVLLG